MKKLLIALLFFPLLSSAESVYQKTIHCFTQQELSSELSKYGEKPVFDFPNDITEKQSNIIMFLNPKTGTWTIIEFNPQMGLACVYGTGNLGKQNVGI